MSTVHSWAAADALAAGGAVLSGYVWEIRQIAALPDAREAMLQWTHAHALRPEALAALLRPALRPLVDEVMHTVRTRFDALASDAADGGDASFRWMMAGYARFHAGAVPWRLSFASWPVLPIMDQDLLATMCAIPREFLSARRMQDEILRTRFPALARLPLDRNADDLRPLLDSPWARARRALRGLADRTRPAGRATRSTVPLERRYYARMYDFDAPGWQAIRRAAEPGREALHEWFLPEALAALVPPAPQRAAHTDPIAQGFGPKMLVGLMQMLAPSGGAAA
jgi:asparagine synthase (glutamine-hydrolysing)